MLGSLADICSAPAHFRFTLESGHVRCNYRCPLWAKSGHLETSIFEIDVFFADFIIRGSRSSLSSVESDPFSSLQESRSDRERAAENDSCGSFFLHESMRHRVSDWTAWKRNWPGVAQKAKNAIDPVIAPTYSRVKFHGFHGHQQMKTDCKRVTPHVVTRRVTKHLCGKFV